MAEGNLAQRLGYPADAKLVIINADDLGSCHSANVGVFECLATGTVTSATLMVPCPWAREASSRYRGEDVGVHLTLNAEYELYRWGPITHAPSLLGGDGGFPSTVEDVWDHADLDEVRRECRAQIERAILWGFDVSHLDSHMGTLQLRPEFFDVYLDLAVEFGLPLRMAGPATERYIGIPGARRRRGGGSRLHRPLPLRGRGRNPPDVRAGLRDAAAGRDRVPAAPGRRQRRAALARHGRLDATGRRLRDDLQRGLGPPLPRRGRAPPSSGTGHCAIWRGPAAEPPAGDPHEPDHDPGCFDPFETEEARQRRVRARALARGHRGAPPRASRPADVVGPRLGVGDRGAQGLRPPHAARPGRDDAARRAGLDARRPRAPHARRHVRRHCGRTQCARTGCGRQERKWDGCRGGGGRTAGSRRRRPPVQAAPPPESDAPAPAVPTRAERRQRSTRGRGVAALRGGLW